MTLLQQLLGEEFKLPPAHTAGTLNHSVVMRNASDTLNVDLSVQMNDHPNDFEQILTAGSTLRRNVKSLSAAIVGVPVNLDDLLAGKLVAANVVDQVNREEPVAKDNSFEDGTVAHPKRVHNSIKAEPLDLIEMVALLTS